MTSNSKFKKMHKQKKQYYLLDIKNKIHLGSFIIVPLTPIVISHSKLELVKSRSLKVLNKKVKVWFHEKTAVHLTEKSEKSRMGKGKGGIIKTTYTIKAGFNLIELDNITHGMALRLLKICYRLLNVKLILHQL